MKVIGTAGHVDHGKSALVKALTGINPDRLKEEQEREMTIDLGFAWMDLPNGEAVGIIDVPGHIDFIDNMLAGVGGIDAALLVVAADEGVMPQTREHAAILDLLEVRAGVVAITKSDLIREDDWLELVVEETRTLLQATNLAGVPIVPVSALTGAGLDQLRDALQEELGKSPDRVDRGKPRLPVDRSFTVSGFGTVITGTLVDGTFAVGDEVLVMPGGHKARVRGLQTHRAKIDHAVAGSRVAMNLSGIEAGQIERGDVVIKPGSYSSTRRLDVNFRLLPDADLPLRHNQHARLYHGAAQRSARIRLLGDEELAPGRSAWLQLELDRPVVAARNDHFILRRPSPGATLGGGQIADAHPARRYKRFDERVLARLDNLLAGTPGEQIQAALHTGGAMGRAELGTKLGLPEEELERGLEELRESGALIELHSKAAHVQGDVLLMESAAFSEFEARVRKILMDYHRRFPLRIGIPVQELRSRLKTEAAATQPLLEQMVENGSLTRRGDRFALPDFSPELSPAESESVAELVEKFKSDPYNTPSVKQVLSWVGEEVLAYLLSTGILIQVGQDVLFTAQDHSRMVAAIREQLSERGTLTVADVRDLFKTSRKYSLALLEDLDTQGITVREGDARRLV